MDGVAGSAVDLASWFTDPLLHSGILDVRTMMVYHFEGYDSETATFKETPYRNFRLGQRIYWETYGQTAQP